MVATAIPFDREVCAACRAETVGHCFMRVYLEEGRLEFCTPACAAVFNRDSQRFGAPVRKPIDTDRSDWR